MTDRDHVWKRDRANWPRPWTRDQAWIMRECELMEAAFAAAGVNGVNPRTMLSLHACVPRFTEHVRTGNMGMLVALAFEWSEAANLPGERKGKK